MTQHVTVGGSVFGGGNMAPVGRGTTVLLDQANAVVTGDVYGGGAKAEVDTLRKAVTPPALVAGDSIQVTLLQGTVHGDVYGGGLGNADTAANVYGPVFVNIGELTGSLVDGFASNESVSGDATILGAVYGCNNLNGTPKDNVSVNIYQTHRTANQETSGTGYALTAVYGGGNQAAYAPVDNTKATQVHVYTCANTIETVYGGGNAADATKVAVIIDGGRFYRVFGGGNGFSLTGNHTNPSAANYNPGANVSVSATTQIHGGRYHQVFGGSNQYGDVAGASLTIDNASGCEEYIDEAFGGANEAVIHGSVTTTLACSNINIGSFYGGSNKANIIDGNVILNVFGGTYTNVFGGSKGTHDTAANIGGNVTLNLYGGTIYNAFGGSDVNGNIGGNITVNVLDYEATNCALDVTNIYGGGNETPYTNSSATSPVVNVMHIGQAEGIRGNVYGGGKGEEATVTANPKVNFGYNSTAIVRDAVTMADLIPEGYPSAESLTSYPHAYIGGKLFGGGDAAPVEGTPTVYAYQGTVDSIFGGGLGSTATVTGNPTVVVNQVGATTRTVADVFGGGDAASVVGNPTVTLTAGTVTNAFGGGNVANVNGTTSVTLQGATVANIYGGGNQADVSSTTVSLTSGNVTAGVYGGCNTSGNVGGNITVSVTGGTVGTNVNRANGIFGGGYGHQTSTTGDVTVTFGNSSESHQNSPVLYGDLYGGSGFGNVNDGTSNTTTVTVLNGEITGNVYGGGLGQKGEAAHDEVPAVPAYAALVNGNVVVNIGSSPNTGKVVLNTYTVNAQTKGGKVFGANNVNGTPKGDVAVNIYATAHGNNEANNHYPLTTISTPEDLATNSATQTYAIAAVFGGGNEAHYTPVASKSATVHVYNCDNTIKDVYGGGNAANVGTTGEGAVPANTFVIIDGGRIHRVFGGGNGEVTPANIYGTATTTVNAGLIDQVFGCGNMQGAITATDLNLTKASGVGACSDEVLGEIFGGANMAELTADISTTIDCGVEHIGSIYGGSNQASINGDVTLTIKGGSYTNVFGGSKGVVDDPSTLENESVAANIDGDVTLNLYGGTIVDAFGGSNQNGNITGIITVNVLNHEITNCGLNITGNIYGAGNVTPYTPTYTVGEGELRISPVVNVMHGSIGGSVYGGGKGATAIVTANPKVNFGYDATTMASLDGVTYPDATIADRSNYTAAVTGNVYGGGDAAAVTGSTTVLMQKSNSTVAKLFGGGNQAGVSETATVTLSDGTVSAGVYGGCNASGSVGNVVMNLDGGTVGAVGTRANVYGGGFGGDANLADETPAGTYTTGDITLTLNGTTVYGDLYGGSAFGSVNTDNGDTTTIIIGSNTLHGTVYGGGQGDATYSATSNGVVVINYNTANDNLVDGIYGGANVKGNVVSDIYVNVNANVGTSGDGNRRDIFGGGLGQNTSTDGNTTVTVGTSGSPVIFGDLYGGSSLGEVGAGGKTAKAELKGGTLNGTIYGGGMGQTSPSVAALVSGGTEAAVSGGTVSGGVYGGCNANGTVTQTSAVNITGGTIGTELSNANVYGGGLGASTKVKGDVDVAIDGDEAVIWGDVYGGSAKGLVNCNDDGNARNGEATTDVTLTAGTIHGSLYGGGHGLESAAAHVWGPVQVTVNGGTVTDEVYGCNNAAGAPQSTVAVDIYGTDQPESGYAIGKVFGGGEEANYAGTPVVKVHNCDNKIGYVYGGGNQATVVGTNVTIYGGNTIGYVFGGCNQANVTTNGTLVNIYGGIIDSVFGGNNKSGTITGGITVNVNSVAEGGSPACSMNARNVFGGGNLAAFTDTPDVNVLGGTAGNVFGGGNKATVTGGDVAVSGGTVANIFGGGNQASVNGNTTVAVSDGYVTTGIYGGCNTTGNVNSTTVTITGGQVGDVNEANYAKVFGGGFGESTNVINDVEVTVGDDAGTATPTIYGELYGGSALGHVNTNSDNTNAALVNTVNTTTINILSGTIKGDIYGGGLGRKAVAAVPAHGEPGDDDYTPAQPAIPDVAALVHGVVHINVGKLGAVPTDTIGAANLENANIFGCNNINGTPENDVFIDIYQTAHDENTFVTDTTSDYYAMGTVYGGGNKADFAPENLNIYSTKKAYIHVHGCDNTIKEIYGGGNAAKVVGDSVLIEGGRFDLVFGGGNGASAPASIGLGGIHLGLRSGRVGYVFEQCNRSGIIDAGAPIKYYPGGGTCNDGKLQIDYHFCGGNLHNIFGDTTYTFTCSGADTVKYRALYGGCRLGSHFGNITLIIEGGTIGNVYGGSMGATGYRANVRRYPDPANFTEDQEGVDPVTGVVREYPTGLHAYLSKPENKHLIGTGGNITIIIRGGKIGNLFGGCNVNGNVEGRITIVIDSTQPEDQCPLDLDYVYGGANLATYMPDTANVDSSRIYNNAYNFPLIQLKSGHVNYDVFGGGYGSKASTDSGYVQANPRIEMITDSRFHVGRNIYGGGSMGQVAGYTHVLMTTGTVKGSVYGGGKGYVTGEGFGLVTKNTLVEFSGGQVHRSIYGGGALGSVGTFTATYGDGESPQHVAGEPKTCAAGTGLAKVLISGSAQVGVVNKAHMHNTTSPGDDEYGYVFCGSQGDGTNSAKANLLAVVDTTYLEMSGGLVTASIYGGSENGQVLHNTHVKVSGGQIGLGYYKDGGGVEHWDDPYSTELWNNAITAVTGGNVTAINTSAANFHECDHWPFGDGSGHYYVYDIFAGEEGYDSHGGSTIASDGKTFFGNVFGGGSGYYPYAAGQWRRAAGRVCGSTKVEITGGHILTNIYGGSELTDVLDSCVVLFKGGTLGVPRTLAQIAAHPVTCYLFGAGKGDERVLFNRWTNVKNVRVEVTGGHIFGSVFGGGEDGHIERNAVVNIKSGAYIGTWGTSYVDGNVFGGGRGFSGTALTAGNVGGDVTVNITGGTMLGSVYGGGRLASVGYGLYLSSEVGYGEMQPDIPDDPGTPGDQSFSRGHITVNISGGTIGKDIAGNVAGAEHCGNVFGGSMGRLKKLDGSYILETWNLLACAKQTEVNISGSAAVKGDVFGGSELGSVTENTEVNISGGTIGRTVSSTRYGGDVYGGGYGYKTPDVSSPEIADETTRGNVESLAGRTYGNTRVNLTGGTILGDVFGGGEMASIGDEAHEDQGNTLVNIGLPGNPVTSATEATGSATIKGDVYGANNISGTPLGNTAVHIYKTAHPAGTAYPSLSEPADAAALATNAETQGYALAAVYGGGNKAAHMPIAADGTTLVYVHYCQENTVYEVYGGGNAANTKNNHVVIDGGRIHRVFGGGNGYSSTGNHSNPNAANYNPGANVLYTAFTAIHGGLIDTVFGGSNQFGDIGYIDFQIDQHRADGGDACTQVVGGLFGGGNEAFGGGGEVTIACGAGTFSEVYGGSNMADVGTAALWNNGTSSDIILNIQGGTIGKVFGGSKGRLADNSDPLHPITAVPANIYGNVIVNVTGGTIGSVYGGSNYNGNIFGTITVNIDSIQTTCPLTISGNVYGGSYITRYLPTNSAVISPVVNIKHGTVGLYLDDADYVTEHGFASLVTARDAAFATPAGKASWKALHGNVFGGGDGTGARTTSNPKVVIANGDYENSIDNPATPVNEATEGTNHIARKPFVLGNVYGGGNLARVYGSTHVDMREGTVYNNIFGGGKGTPNNADSGSVRNNTLVEMSAGTVLGSIYGGGELGSVGYFEEGGGTGLAQVNISGGTVGATDPYVFFTGDVPANLSGNRYETVPVKNGYYVTNSESPVTTYFKNATVNNILKHTATGNVFGGSMGSTTLANGTLNTLWPSLARVKKTRVTISGNAVIRSSVYGGGELGTVLDSTTVNILGGTIGTEIVPADAALKTELQKYSNPDKFAYFYSLKDNTFKKKKDEHGDLILDEHGNSIWEFNEDSVRAILKLDTFFYNQVPSSYQTHADPHYHFGSVYGGGYGSKDLTVPNSDLTLPSELPNAPARLAPVDIAGRVYGNTYVNVKGGTIRENVFGGGDVASVGTNVYNGSHEITGTEAGKGICTVTIGKTVADAAYAEANSVPEGSVIAAPEIGPLDFTGMNANVYGAGRGVGNDAGGNYNQYCNVDSTLLTVSGGHIWGSTFGGGADCHVLGSTGTVIQEGSLIGDLGITEFDGYVIGGGRNYLNLNNTAGRVQGNTYVTMTGGRLMCSIIGGGALSLVGVDEDGDVSSFMTYGDNHEYDSINHGFTHIRVSGDVINTGKTAFTLQDSLDYKDFIGTTDVDAEGNIIVYKTAIGTGFGPYLLDCDYSIGDIFGGGKGDTRDTLDIIAGRVMNTDIKVTGSPRIMADIYAGGEMGCIGWYATSGDHKNVYYENTGYTHVTVGQTAADSPFLGTHYEFSPINFRAGVTWSIVDPNTKRLLHTCSGNIYGGGQGYVENYGDENGNITYERYKNWVSVGRVRHTNVTINGVRMMGHVFGGGSRGTVAENCHVTVTGGRIGCVIKDETDDCVPNHKRYHYGSVFGGGYGNPKNFYLVNDSSGVDANGNSIPMRPAEHAGRVYGNTYVNVTGGHIMDCIFGGGDLASIGWVERKSDGTFDFATASKRHHGVCTVNITGNTVVGPLDYTGHNAYVYGAGRGEAVDPNQDYKNYANANETHLTINLNGDLSNYTLTPAEWVPATHGGRIWGSSFGGGADAHVLGDVNTLFQGGIMGTDGTTTYDGNIFGAGRNYHNSNYTNGRVAGNVSVSMTGGRLMGSIFGGGRLALSGVDVDGVFPASNWTPVDHGNVTLNVSGGFIGNPDGETLLNGSDESIGDIFGSGKGDTKNYDDVVAGRVMNTHVHVSGDPRIYGCVYGGGEMAGVGWWGNDVHHTFVPNTGLTDVNVSGGTIGTELERDPSYLHLHRDDEDDWTVVVDGRVTHTCTGNVVGGSMGDVDLLSPHWISFGRSRESHVTITGSPVIMSNVYGGAEQGVVTENTYVNVSGGTIGTLIPAYTVTENETTYKYPSYAFGSVYGGGYGSERWWDTARNDEGTLVSDCYNDSCLFDGGNRTHYIAPTMIAGRVYGNTNVTINGGTIRENVFGGGNMASVGYIERDANGEEYLLDSTKWHGGICKVVIKDSLADATYAAAHSVAVGSVITSPTIGPNDHTLMNGHVYGAGKGVGDDPEGYFKRYCNVDSTSLTVSGGHIYGSTFGGGADCHVLRNTRTLIEEGAYIGSGEDTEEYDGCVLGGGRNALNTTPSAGRVQGHTYVTVTGGRIRRTVLGGGAMARVGVDVDGGVTAFLDGNNVYDSTWHGSTFVDVSGKTDTVTGVRKTRYNYAHQAVADSLGFTDEDSVKYARFLTTTYCIPATNKIVVFRTTIGGPDDSTLVDNDYTIGDIFGGGKGDTKDTVDIFAGRVMNTHVKVHGSPRIMADIYAGGEMSCVGWYDTTRTNPKRDVYYGKTGYTHLEISGSPYGGTPFEFSETNIYLGRAWTLIDSLGRLYHTCSGNIYGGGQGYVEKDGTHIHNWVQMGRVRKTDVVVHGGRFLGNVFGGGSRGFVKEDCIVKISGGHFGCVITDSRNGYGNNMYYYGSVFGGGYGNNKTFYHRNDSSFVTTRVVEGNTVHDTLEMMPIEFAGRVYGNTYLTVTGGHIMNCVYGGGDMASTGWVERDPATGDFYYDDKTKRHGGICSVYVSGKVLIGPLDYNGHNAYVYGAGKGIDYDRYSQFIHCANVNETYLTVELDTGDLVIYKPALTPAQWDTTHHGGRIWGSLFGGGADAHVLGDVHTTLHRGVVGTTGISSYDGNIFGAGRNYHNSNHTNGRVQGNIYVLMDGGTIQGSIFGGGRLALSGIDVNGHYIDANHGNVDIQVRGNATIGTSNSADLLIGNESCGDIFGSGKGDTKKYVDIWSGRVNNVKITVYDSLNQSPRIHGGVFGGGEMASLGYWDDTITDGSGNVIFHTNGSGHTNYGVFYPNSGRAVIKIIGGVTIGTLDEFTHYTKPTHDDPAQRVYASAPYENPGVWTMYDASGRLFHTATGNVYGGSQGDVDQSAPRWVSMGRSHSSEVTIGKLDTAGPTILGCVFGGAEQGIMTGNTQVTINSGTIGTRTSIGTSPNTYVLGDVYGAGYGSDDPADNAVPYIYENESGVQCTIANPVNDSSVARRALEPPLSDLPSALAGRVFGDTRVDILGGHILGSVYGGGSFAPMGYERSSTYGNTLVNIGSPTTPAKTITPTPAGVYGKATIDSCVFGANNYEGTPYGNTEVNIYRTAHTAPDTCPTFAHTMTLVPRTDSLSREDVEALPEAPVNFALKAVYGGGNKAAHAPMADTGTTFVHVWYCEENTIYQLYGGGNAADTKNNHIFVEGGRIYEVFGGGNGYSATGNHTNRYLADGVTPDPNYNPGANVSGTAKTQIEGGLITHVFGGSNSKGNVGNTDLEVEKGEVCDMMVANTYGGGNEAEGGGGVITVGCGTHMGSFYGGARNAHMGTPENPVDLVLNIKGGTFENVFGGSMGTNENPADIYGTVTVNVFGGNIQKLFGGSDVNGNITGQIIINVDLDSNIYCDDGLRLDTIYGGGNLALYLPTNANLASPEINIINDSVAMVKPDGLPLTLPMGYSVVDDKLCKTFDIHTVFGGSFGNNTNHPGHCRTTGADYTADTLTGYMKSNPVVNIGGLDMKWDTTHNPQGRVDAPYRRNIAVIEGNVYGGGSSAPLEGNPTVTLYSSRISHIDTIHYDPPAPDTYDTTLATKDHDTTLVRGSVFGGGWGMKAKVHGNTTVGIFGDATVVEGSVYGGGEASVLEGSTDVQVGYEKTYVCHLPVITIAHTNEVTLYSATPGATIYYTKDGSVPAYNENGPTNITTFTYNGPFYAEANWSIRAIAVKPNIGNSLIMTATTVPLPAPTISIAGSTATITNTIDHGQSGVTLYYTTDGTAPSATNGTASNSNSVSFTVTSGQTIKAIAVKTGFVSSPVTIKTVTP